MVSSVAFHAGLAVMMVVVVVYHTELGYASARDVCRGMRGCGADCGQYARRLSLAVGAGRVPLPAYMICSGRQKTRQKNAFIMGC